MKDWEARFAGSTKNSIYSFGVRVWRPICQAGSIVKEEYLEMRH